MSEVRRVLGISPTSRGFGFSVLEDGELLMDWGLAHVRPPEPQRVVSRAVRILERHRPDLVVLPDWEGSRYGERSREVLELLAEAGRVRGVEIVRIDGEEVRRRFADAGLTKHDRAMALAERFPELSPRLPKKRRSWQTEDQRMAIFEAVSWAIALTMRVQRSDNYRY